jgi:hypothetical protein
LPRCTSRQQNAHITERRVVLYRWHPWHGRSVSVAGMTVRAGTAILRCRTEDDSGRSFEVPEWMFDAATCCRIRLASAPIVTYAALRAVRELVEAAERIPARPVRQTELPTTEGATHAIDEPAFLERSTTAISSHGASAMERRAGGDARSDGAASGATAAPAYASPPSSEGAP